MNDRSRWLSIPAATVICALCAAAAPAPATPAAPATQSSAASTRPTDAEIRDLAARLGSDDWKTRQAAQERLGRLPLDARPLLQSLAAQARDEEVRSRLESAIFQIEASDTRPPTLVSLTLDNVPAAEAVARLAEQGHVDVRGWPDWVFRNAKPVTLKVDREPFWIVLRKICEQARLHPQEMGWESGITLTSANDDNWSRRPSVEHDGFLVVAESATRTHGVDFAQPEQVSTSFVLSLSTYIDPRVRVFRCTGSPLLDEVTDDNGQSLIPPGYKPNESFDGPMFHNKYTWQQSASLNWTPQTGRRIKLLKARLRFLVEGRHERWEIADVLNAKGVVRQVGDVRYTVQEVKETGKGNYNVRFTIEYPQKNRPPNENPLTDYNVIRQSIELQDADGKSYQSNGGGGGGGNGNLSYSLNYSAQARQSDAAAGPATRLVWTIPVEVKTVEVPIEFKDLPIP